MSKTELGKLRKELLSCEYSLKHKKRDIIQLNEFLEDKNRIIEYQKKENNVLKTQVKQAKDVIKSLGSMNDDHISITEENTTLRILLEEVRTVINGYFHEESTKGNLQENKEEELEWGAQRMYYSNASWSNDSVEDTQDKHDNKELAELICDQLILRYSNRPCKVRGYCLKTWVSEAPND